MGKELNIDGLKPEDLESARESLVELYEMVTEYAKAMSALSAVSRRMAQKYEVVNKFLHSIKEEPGAAVAANPFVDSEDLDPED